MDGPLGILELVSGSSWLSMPGTHCVFNCCVKLNADSPQEEKLHQKGSIRREFHLREMACWHSSGGTVHWNLESSFLRFKFLTYNAKPSVLFILENSLGYSDTTKTINRHMTGE